MDKYQKIKQWFANIRMYENLSHGGSRTLH